MKAKGSLTLETVPQDDEPMTSLPHGIRQLGKVKEFREESFRQKSPTKRIIFKRISIDGSNAGRLTRNNLCFSDQANPEIKVVGDVFGGNEDPGVETEESKNNEIDLLEQQN